MTHASASWGDCEHPSLEQLIHNVLSSPWEEGKAEKTEITRWGGEGLLLNLQMMLHLCTSPGTMTSHLLFVLDSDSMLRIPEAPRQWETRHAITTRGASTLTGEPKSSVTKWLQASVYLASGGVGREPGHPAEMSPPTMQPCLHRVGGSFSNAQGRMSPEVEYIY